MDFHSFLFLLFFPAAVLGYYLLPYRVKHIWLLAASYYFYACWNVLYVVPLLCTTVITFFCGRGIEKLRRSEGRQRVGLQKLLAAAGIFASLALLFLFRYLAPAAGLVETVGGWLGLSLQLPSFNLLLPIGISFFTLQAISYLADVHRGTVKAEKDFVQYALFLSFFPKLAAGPVERAKGLLSQLNNPRRFNFNRALKGLMVMLWGYFLKLVIADRLAIFVGNVYGQTSTADGMHLLIAALLFAVQIYCEFYGYTTIALGAAKVLGINLTDSFNAPYFSISVSEFWQNFHISLTAWFRDYLYIPLGGNRKGKIRACLNKIIVFLISGLWHGPSLTFAAWGALNGLYLALGSLLRPLRRKVMAMLKIKKNSAAHCLTAGLITFLLICFSWIFFRADSIAHALSIITGIFTGTHISALMNGSLLAYGVSSGEFILLAVCLAILLFADICKFKGTVIHQWLGDQKWLRFLAIALTVCFILLFGVWGPGHDGSNFYYFFQF